MEVNQSIFRSYDIRGIYPEELNEETAYKIGQSFTGLTGAKKVVLGRDMRISSPKLHDAVIRGILSQGADVYDMGEVLTELIYFAVGSFKYDAGIMITASHNPKEYNGFKMIKKQGDNFLFFRGKDLTEVVIKNRFEDSGKKGTVKTIDIWQNYINHIFSAVNPDDIKPFKVVIDAGNGMWGKLIPMIEKKLPIKIIPLNFELDGNFPNHPSNPVEKGVTEQIAKKILQEKADFGFVFDGDGDRLALIDENGRRVLADIALLPMAKYFLDKNPKETIVFQVVGSKSVSELVEKWGGKSIRTPVGFVNIREAMIKENSPVGGEISGHYCFKDNFYADSGLLAFLILLKVISKSGKRVSDLISDLTLFYKEEEINFIIDDKEEMINKIKEKYSDGKQNFIDGITVEYKDWWFNVRPSNTEPLLRLNIEAKTQELLEEKKKELTDFIEQQAAI